MPSDFYKFILERDVLFNMNHVSATVLLISIDSYKNDRRVILLHFGKRLQSNR